MKTRLARRREHRNHLSRPRPYCTRLFLEPLEPRRLLDAYGVTSLLDNGGEGTLRWAIDQANGHAGPDQIEFAVEMAGTITLSGTELSITDPVTIAGPGADQITVSGNDLSRVFNVDDSDPGTSIVVSLSGLTITRGIPAAARQGGGIFSQETLTLTDCVVTANQTPLGNMVGDKTDGGGIYSSGSLTMLRCTVSDNRTGGGFNGGDGGGICSDNGQLVMSACTVSGNVTGTGVVGTGGAGGGVYASGTMTMSHCTVSGNVAGEDASGGGVYYVSAPLSVSTIRNSTIHGNQVEGSYGHGGGIYHDDGSLDLESTILAGNTASFGPDFYGESGAIPSAEYCLIGNNKDCNTFFPASAPGTNIIGTNPSPIDSKLGPLLDNGGPTKTHAPLALSPVIDHGVDWQGLSYDQRGEPFLRAAGPGGPDIGSYERQIAAIPPLVVDTLADESDGDYGPGDLSLREAIGLANGSIGPDAIGFSGELFEAGPGIITLARGALVITDDLTVSGPGANLLTIDARRESRVLAVPDFDPGTQVQALIAGIHLTGGDAGSGTGGGINNYETLTLFGCMISSCHAEYGGAIYNADVAHLVIENSTLFANSAFLDGGAIESNGTLTVFSSTLSGNEAGRYGGGIDFWAGALEIRNSTIAANAADLGGGLYCNPIGTSILWSTVVADNTAFTAGPDIHGTVHSANRFNLVGDGSDMAGITHGVSGNQVGVDARLLPLRDYGGRTLTHSLRAGSPAIDRGTATPGFEVDQRGVSRPIDLAGVPNADDGTDIGAFETYGAPLTLTVSITEDENDGNFAPNDLSLREAIALSNGNDWDDTIDFDLPPGEHTIMLTMGELSITDGVTITGPGADVLTLHGNHASRIFKVDDDDLGTTHNVVVSGLTITGGVETEIGEGGGGIHNRENLTLTDTLITGNVTRDSDMDTGAGGGIYNFAGDLTLLRCTVSENSTGASGNGVFSGNGGGVANRIGLLTMTDCVIEGNRTGDGGDSTHMAGGFAGAGGGVSSRGPLTMTNCLVLGNTTGRGGHNDSGDGARGGYGGGISCAGSGPMTFTHCSIVGNTTGGGGEGTGGGSGGSGGGGGGLASFAFNTTLSYCSVEENRTGDGGANGGTGGRGGGILKQNSRSLTIEHSTIANNRTGDGGVGGGMAIEGTMWVFNSTLSGNTAGAGASGGAVFHNLFFAGDVETIEFHNTTIHDNEVLGSGHGGGIYFLQGDLLLQSTILAGNRAAGAPDLYLDPAGSPAATANYCLIGNNDGSGFNPAWPAPDTLGNYIGEPGGVVNPMLGPLAENGGPTRTHGLLPCSPAIHAGETTAIAGVGNVPEFDQRGAPFGRILGGRIDMGAFEVQTPSADFDLDGNVDGDDLGIWRNGFGIQNSATFVDGDADEDGDVDGADFLCWQRNLGNCAATPSAGSAALVSDGGALDSVRGLSSPLPLPIPKTVGNITFWLAPQQFQWHAATRPFQRDRAVDAVMARWGEPALRFDLGRLHGKAEYLVPNAVTIEADLEMALEGLFDGPLW